MKSGKITIVGAACLALCFGGCQKDEAIRDGNVGSDVQQVSALGDAQSIGGLGGAAGAKVSVFSAEYITTGESGQIGRTVYFNDRGNKQLTADFVPGLNLDGSNNISYYVDNTRPSNDLSAAVTSAAIDRAMSTWDGVQCSNLGITKVPSNSNLATGFVAQLLGFGGSSEYVADVVHAGWLPRTFFDMIAEDGGDFILGVTFTIVFEDQDADNDGKADVAWREIYYNDAFAWNNGSTYDVETIALHEAGHGLSQGHFGSAFETQNGKLHFAPRTVMNAAYSGVQTTINQNDLAGHCSNWASWPNN